MQPALTGGAMNIFWGAVSLRNEIVFFFILIQFLRLLNDPSVNHVRSQTF